MKLLKMKSKIADETAALCLDNVDTLTRQFMILEKSVPTHLFVSPALERNATEITNHIAVRAAGNDRNTPSASFVVVVNPSFEPTEWAIAGNA